MEKRNGRTSFWDAETPGRVSMLLLALVLGHCLLGGAGFSQSKIDEWGIPSGWGRDPFQRAQSEKSPASSSFRGDETYALTGILQRGSGSLAIINRVLVREGDILYDARVVRIEAASVHLVKDGEEIILRMGGK